MKGFVRKCLIALSLVPAVAYAQEVFYLNQSSICSYTGAPHPSAVYGFASSGEADGMIRNIMSHVGLKKNFIVQSSDVSNAAALIRGDNRYILYNKRFIARLNQNTNSKWASMSVLAHEIGHHLNGHTLDDIGSRPKTELEADEFSGFVLGKMGASLSEAQLAMRHIGSERASTTHPAKSDRLYAIKRGWERALRQSDSRVEPSTTNGNMRTINVDLYTLRQQFLEVSCHDTNYPSKTYEIVGRPGNTDIEVPDVYEIKCRISFSKRREVERVYIKQNHSVIFCTSDLWGVYCKPGNPIRTFIDSY